LKHLAGTVNRAVEKYRKSNLPREIQYTRVIKTLNKRTEKTTTYLRSSAKEDRIGRYLSNKKLL
jgi:hypothetical protein